VQYLTVWDLVLTPIYLIVLTAIARRQRNKRYPVGHLLRPYYLKGLYVKFGGAIFIALVFQYYYGGGDTFNYFYHSRTINSALSDSFSTWIKLIFRKPFETNPELYPYITKLWWYRDPSSYLVGSIGAILGVLNGTSYIPIALLFAYFSYTGIWAMYRTFVNIYPKLYKPLAVAFLFIPSTVVWGSAMFKDTVCMFGLGWLTYTVFRIFINRDFSIKNLFLLTLSFYLIYKIKIYILLAFMPALAMWLLGTYSSRIQSGALRFISRVAFLIVCAGGFFLFTRMFSEELNRYSLENIEQTAAETRGWINYASGDEGSAYDLGPMDPSIGGMLKKFPQAVVVTLFRPFPWEARKLIVLLSALEALAFVYFTYKAFRNTGLINGLKMISRDPNLFFCLIFSFIFAFAVGISSYNFGALSRYKIPCLPFYATILVVLLYSKTAIDKPQYKKRRAPVPAQ
jgi:hypothetical protein